MNEAADISVGPDQTASAGSSMNVKVRILSSLWNDNPPTYATAGSAGVDLRACLGAEEAVIEPGERLAVPCGLAIEVETPGVAGFVFSRSGLGTKLGLVVSQGVGVIDPDYRGEIVVSLLNTSKEPRRIERGERIAQLVFMPVFTANLVAAESLGETARGAGGFGHTGSR